jgi:hypothetical protein
MATDERAALIGAQRALLGEVGHHVGRDRDRQAVQHPGHAEGHDHPGVESRPGQPVDPCGYGTAYRRALCRSRRRRHRRTSTLALLAGAIYPR